MIAWIKKVLKRFLPPPVYAFNREIERVIGSIRAVTEQVTQCRDELAAQQQTLEERQLQYAQRQSELLENQSLLLQRQVELASQQTGMLEQMRRKLDHMETALPGADERSRACFAGLAAESGALRELLNAHAQLLDEVRGELKRGNAELRRQAECESLSMKERMETLSDRQAGAAQARQAELLTELEKLGKSAQEGKLQASEAVWAEIFNNTISGSTWLTNRTFSPGRWAIGYQALYAMYRILNEARPKRILELGLGQSTRMIAQYAAAFDDVEHIVVEHDQDWIDFFRNDFALSGRTEIVRLDREMVAYKDAAAVRVFKGFGERFAGERFDFIFIDAPLGSDMKQYARIDVLKLLPNCLMERFVVMLDDCERPGEQHTIFEMEQALKQNRILFNRGVYKGAKDVMVWTSPDQKFLCSM